MAPRVDSEHRGPLVNIAAWVTLVAMILFTFSKVATKWKMIRTLQSDDYFMLLAMLTAVGQCVAGAIQVDSGLGSPEDTVDVQHLGRYQKATYAAEIFYVVTIFTAKMAAMQFLVTLTRPSLKQTVVRAIIGFIALWVVVAVMCISFQCNIPSTWDQVSGKCFNLLAFWIVNAVVDIITQLIIGFSPIYLLLKLQLPVPKKRLAMASFTPNITTIPLTVLRLVYLFKASYSSDLTLSSFDAALIMEIHTNFSVIAACLPFLKPMVDSLAIGLMTNDIRIPVESEEVSRSKDKVNPFALLGGKGFNTRNFYGWTRSQSSGYTSTVTAGKGHDIELNSLERYGSQERMVINQTKTTVVSSDPIPPPSVHNKIG